MIDGDTRLIAHVGYPTTTFKSPMIYNPWFARKGINAAVVPLGVRPENFVATFPQLCRLSNFAGALVTMPHKVAVLELVEEASPTVMVCGACNAVRLDQDDRLVGEMFDGEGFVRGARAHGVALKGASALVVGCGGVGSAIAASLAAAGVKRLGLFDPRAATMESLGGRLAQHYKAEIALGSADPDGYDIVVNATPLGMKAGDPLPLDVERLAPSTFVGEVVLKQERTPLIAAAEARGCKTQIGLDMLFAQIPAYLEFFGFGAATAQELREGATIGG